MWRRGKPDKPSSGLAMTPFAIYAEELENNLKHLTDRTAFSRSEYQAGLSVVDLRRQISKESPMQLSNTVRVVDHQDGAMLLDVERGKFFSVDPVGRLIVSLLREPIKANMLLDRWAESFPHIGREALK